MGLGWVLWVAGALHPAHLRNIRHWMAARAVYVPYMALNSLSPPWSQNGVKDDPQAQRLAHIVTLDGPRIKTRANLIS